MKAPSADILVRFGVTDPVFVTKTGLAELWKVQKGDVPAALKIYHDGDPKNEWPGFELIDALDGAGVVQVYQYQAGVALMEWLDGPSLGDMARDDDDAKAAEILVQIANRLHTAAHGVTIGLPTVTEEFDALFRFHPPADMHAGARQNVARCIGLARKLLNDQVDPIPLHGDLHHDNIKLGAEGYKAFDAKGIIGERAFEFANTFPNPIGIGDLAYDPTRARMLADIWGQAADLSPRRLLEWAVVRAALSLSWGSDFGIVSELQMIAMFLELLDQG